MSGHQCCALRAAIALLSDKYTNDIIDMYECSACHAGGITVDLRNPSHLAELIPHHEHTSLDGLSPVDILKPADDR